MNEALPPGWDFVKLSSVANIEMGQSPPSSDVTEILQIGLPFLQGNAEFSETHPIPTKWCDPPKKT